MDKIKHILKTQYGIECTDLAEVHGGLSAMNYQIQTDGKPLFLKIYDKKKSQASLWTENIDCYIPILAWLNENTDLQGRIAHPRKTIRGNYRYEDEENVFLLFNYIEGKPVGKTLTPAQILETADIIAFLHNVSNEIPVNMEKIKEDFSVPFCLSLEQYILDDFSSSPAEVREILQPHLIKLISVSKELKSLSEKVKQKENKMVLCHTDAHGWNLMQNERLVLVDWEGIKLAPAEADLVMFTKKNYWDIFIEHYNKLRPSFILDNELLMFYILRRKIEDIWAFIASILFDEQPVEQQERDLAFLSGCCYTFDDLYFEL